MYLPHFIDADFALERERRHTEGDAAAGEEKDYYDFDINSLVNKEYDAYDARFFRAHVIRSGKLTFNDILSTSQIIFQVSTSGKINLVGKTKADDDPYLIVDGGPASRLWLTY